MKKALALLAMVLSGAFVQSGGKLIDAPRIWNDRDLSEWTTPVAGLNVRPGHYSEKEYYSAPVGEFVRTYPVYFPGREPAGYWDMLRNSKPELLIKPGARTMADWVEEGKRVFHELDIPSGRIYDPSLVETLRSADQIKQLGGQPREDGTLSLRWVPTSKGLAIGLSDCGGCHTRLMPDGSILDGAQRNEQGIGRIARGSTDRSEEFPDDSAAMILWREFAVPWVPNDVNDRLKTMDAAERRNFGLTPGTPLRNNAGPFYPAAIPDLIGVKDRKYIDRTATHRLRGRRI